jgi:hypothetical protein
MRWFCGVFLAAWIGVCYQYLKAEVRSLLSVPSLWVTDIEAKWRSMDVPLYEFIQRVKGIVPDRSDANIYLFALDNGVGAVHAWADYHLYPRSLHPIGDPADIRRQDIPAGAYLMVYVQPELLVTNPMGVQRAFDDVAEKLPPVVRIYRTPFAGIYRFASRDG